MGAAEVITYITTLEAENRLLREHKATQIDAGKFYNVLLTTGEVAKMHGVSRSRVAEYAKRGIIEKHPDSTDEKLCFRMSDALTWDFAELKRKWMGGRHGGAGVCR